jgi:hypothetical protein
MLYLWERHQPETTITQPKLTQSNKIAVAFLLFSFLQQVCTTFLQTLVAGINPLFVINSNNLTANFQLLSSHALPIARL